ncbi:MAG: transketolase C-terminal domain-containing protein, partial [Stenotrophomonas sp.]
MGFGIGVLPGAGASVASAVAYANEKRLHEGKDPDAKFGKGDLRVQGSRVALLAFGSTVPAAEVVGRELGLSVVNMRFIKPLDRTLLLDLARTHDGFVTIEDNVVAGGAGSGVAELFNAEDVLKSILHLGLPDSFQHHASREDLLAEAGIDAAGIRAAVLKRWPALAGQSHPLSAAG